MGKDSCARTWSVISESVSGTPFVEGSLFFTSTLASLFILLPERWFCTAAKCGECLNIANCSVALV